MFSKGEAHLIKTKECRHKPRETKPRSRCSSGPAATSKRVSSFWCRRPPQRRKTECRERTGGRRKRTTSRKRRRDEAVSTRTPSSPTRPPGSGPPEGARGCGATDVAYGLHRRRSREQRRRGFHCGRAGDTSGDTQSAAQMDAATTTRRRRARRCLCSLGRESLSPEWGGGYSLRARADGGRNLDGIA